MNYWLLSLSLLNILLLAYVSFNHLVKNKTKTEDQRLTKGLQLLQNKISILQDLSDKTDEQVRKWVYVIEQKSGEVKNQLMKSDEKIIQIEKSLSKALDVSKIYYEQVPHSEMLDRQKTSKYVQAAKLANQGYSTDQISQKIDLSAAELEMIFKMNRKELQFAENSLPGWVRTSISENSKGDADELLTQELNNFTAQILQMQKVSAVTRDLTSDLTAAKAFEVNQPDMTSMNQIKQQLASAVTDTLAQNSTQIPQTFLDDKKQDNVSRTPSGKIVRPFEFRKITKY